MRVRHGALVLVVALLSTAVPPVQVTWAVGADEPAARTTGSQPPRAPVAERVVTFNNQIARLFQQHCQVCHRPGEAAPFSLTTYGDAYPWRQQILLATASRRMPPWKPVAGHGDFTGVRRLADAEIALIRRWV